MNRHTTPFSPPPAPVKGEGELHPVDAGRIRPASVLPRGLRWMQGMLPQSAGVLAAHVSVLVESHPEVKVFVAECPQVGRVLRPLCRLAGLTAPDYLRLPKRVRSSPRPSPQRGEGEGRRMAMPRRRDFATARDQAAAWLRWSEATKKPVDPRKMSAVAFGYVLHWPRDGNCPPPEIGYGGRTFPPLPKDYVRPKDDDE